MIVGLVRLYQVKKQFWHSLKRCESWNDNWGRMVFGAWNLPWVHQDNWDGWWRGATKEEPTHSKDCFRSCTDHVADHALITWVIMNWSRGLSYTAHVADHALITLWMMHWSRGWSYTDHVTHHAHIIHALCKTDQIVHFKQVHYKTYRCILFCAHNKIKK